MRHRGPLIWIALAWGVSSLGADVWPQWRGPAGDGVSPERNLPIRWSRQENVVWKTALPGGGNSTPAVWGDSIFLTSQVEAELHVLRLEGSGGRIVWDRSVSSGTPTREGPQGSAKYHRLHNMASPSPVTDGRHVFVHFGNGYLAALDLEGRVVWERNLATDHGEYTIWWGHANSPVLFEDLVISVCMQDPKGKSYLVAHDKASGRVRWLAERDTGATAESGDAYTTPILCRTPQRLELVVMGGNVVDAYDPATGTRLWYCEGLAGGRTITGPAMGNSTVFVTAGMRGPLCAVPIGGTGPVTGTILWTHTANTPDAPCPVHWQNLLFLVSDDGVATCLDSRKGTVRWRERLGGNFKASPVAADGHVYFLDMQGTTTVVAAAPDFSVVSRNALEEESLASPAIAGGRIFLRTRGHLYCIGPASDGNTR